MVILLDSKRAWPLLNCRPGLLAKPGNLLGSRAGIIAVRVFLRGILFLLAKARQWIFLQAAGPCALDISGGASIYWDL
jgi:hypothetical protein